MVNLDAIPDDSTGTTLKQYASQGSKLNRSMLMDFFAAVPSQAAGEKLSKALEEAPTALLRFVANYHHSPRFMLLTAREFCCVAIVDSRRRFA